MKRHIWEIRERSAGEWIEERGKGWRQSGRKRGNVCRKITPWISERDSRTDWKKKQENTRSGLSRLEKLKPHRDYRQKYRQTDKLILSGSVNLCTSSWSMIPRWHIFTSQPSPQLPLCRCVDYTDAPSHPSYVSQRGCDMTSGGPRACSWQLFISHPLQSLPCCGPSVKCFQPCSCSSAPHAS